MRYWLFFIGALGALVAAGPAAAQNGFDRRGGDYTNFQVRSGDPAECAARCERDARCRAWSFSYPATARALAICWLKAQVPRRAEDKCCVSGVRGGGVVEPRTRAAEFSIDRLGGDYRNFEVKPDATGEACKAACEGDKSCRAWTYARAGYFGPAPRCYLKSEIKRPRRQPCCISGVVR